MKWSTGILFCVSLVTGCVLMVYNSDEYKIIIEPLWQDLDQDSPTTFESKWILVGSVTFEKRPKEPVSIHRLHFKWNGPHLDNLTASLYRKLPDKDFYPLESNLVCDGVWSETKQTIRLTFDEEKTLGPRTIFYLVVTIPSSVETILKKGSFVLVSHTLPESFRSTLDTDLCLSLDAVNSSITTCNSDRKR